MTPRNLERRVEKLEQAIEHVAGGKLFMVWGKSGSEIRQAFRQAHIAGEIREGDSVNWCLWPLESQMPAPRWTTMSMLSTEELKALIADLRDKISHTPNDEMDRQALAQMTDAEIDAAVASGAARFDPAQLAIIADGIAPE